jgi:hypothetical protein
VKLRKPCKHDRYEKHYYSLPHGDGRTVWYPFVCPGGESLDVTLEKTYDSSNSNLPRPKYRYVTEWLFGHGPYEGPTDPAEWLRSVRETSNSVNDPNTQSVVG